MNRLFFTGIVGLAVASCGRSPSSNDPSTDRSRPAARADSRDVSSGNGAAREADAGDAPFAWPVPAGWKHETIPFPLEFAPGLPYRGLEEIRFMPGFFDPPSPGYFSYAFVWVLDDKVTVDASTIAANLRDYFIGLARAVADGKFEVDASRVRVSLSDLPKPDGGAGAFAGTARIVDAFTTRRDVDLAIEGEIRDAARHRAIVIAASPQPKATATWTALHLCTASFALHE